jgi:hypothetical protein
MKDGKSDFVSKYNKQFSANTAAFAVMLALAELITFFIICSATLAIYAGAYISYGMGGLTYEGAKWVISLVEIDSAGMSYFAAGSMLSLVIYAFIGRMSQDECKKP